MTDPLDTPEFRAYARRVRRELIPKLQDSAATVSVGAMTARLALSLSAAAALGSALGFFVVGTPTTFGVSLAASMALGIAADLSGRWCSR